MKLLKFALAVVAFLPFRPASAAELSPLTNLASAREMAPAEARLHHPVRLRATVLVSLPFWHLFVAHDGKTGLSVSTGTVSRPDIVPGTVVDIEGTTAAGDFTPIIEAQKVAPIGSALLPPANPVTLDQLLSGQYDSQWIETQGIVRAVFTRKGRLMLSLGSAGARMEVLVNSATEEEARHLVGSRIGLRGTAAGIFNHKHRLVGVSIYNSGFDDIQVLHSAPQDLFSLPLTTLQDVARYTPGWNPELPLHIKGVLSAQWPGKSVFLTDGAQSIEILTGTDQLFQPGDHLDIVAFRASDNTSYNLGDAEIRLLSHGVPPEPKPIDPNQALTGGFDQSLVRVDGQLIGSQVGPNQAALTVKSGDRVFVAFLPGTPSPALTGLFQDGARVRLSGIFIMDDTSSNRPLRPVKSFRVVMRSPADFQVLQNPSWWTTTHALSTLTLLLAAVFCILAWVVALRRRVKFQTRVIQQQLQEAQVLTERAEAANRSKSEFLASMSHDIRTPMNGIIGMSDFLFHSNLTEDQQECLNVVRVSADSLLNLINDILDFSKIEAGKLDMDSVEFNLRECLTECTRMLSFRASEKGLNLTCTVQPEIPEMMIGDPSRLRQIILNLAGNAIKFTEAGLVAIEVTQEEEGFLHFVVRDTGIGIKTEQQRTIFEPFVQSDSSINRKFGGTGLGLSICSRLVEMMKGKIWVVSQVGIGSRFHFTARFGTAVCAAPPPKIAAPQDDSVAEGLRILVAEDNAVNLKIITRVLEKEGHTVLSAGNGRQALEVLDREPVDLIIMDVHMPEMDGLQTAAEIRKRDKKAGTYRPIIAATACAMKGDREKCLAAGMDAYVTKPIRTPQLLQVIDSIVARDRSRQLVAT